MQQFVTASLDDDQVARWRQFSAGLPFAHYQQDPAWGETQRGGPVWSERRPYYFSVESHGELCLTAVGVRRQLPVPNRAFWEFTKGPVFEDPDVFEQWLSWLVPALGRGAARLTVWPSWKLDEGGDDIETILERRGFLRRRVRHGWSTLVVDLNTTEDELMESFRRETRRNILKSLNAGLSVRTEDNPRGWSTLRELQMAMAARVSVEVLSTQTLARISRYWLNGAGGGTVLIGRSGDTVISAAMVVVHKGTAHLMAFASRRVGNLPTSYLVVWESMRWAKARGCTTFDLGGYSLVDRSGGPLSGVKQFKRGFAPRTQPVRFVALHERINDPIVQGLAVGGRRLEAALRHAARRSTR